MKRICSLLCAAALGLSGTAAVFPAGLTAFAEEDAPTSGTCGENLTWTLGSEGTLTISGSGEMGGWFAHLTPWAPHADQIKKVVLPEGLGMIRMYAFNNLKNLTDVTIPESVQTIDDWAFVGCTSLKKITIPENVLRIGIEAFGGTALTELTIPNPNCALPSEDDRPLVYSDMSAEGYTMNCVIHGYAGSTAEAYAKENNIPFIGLDDAPAFITSDLTGDGATDVADAVLFARALAEDAAADLKNPLPDLNGDGLITLLDLRALLRSL